MKPESIWLVLLEQNLYNVIQKLLENLAQDTDLCAAVWGKGDTTVQELAEHQLSSTGSLLQQLSDHIYHLKLMFSMFLMAV